MQVPNSLDLDTYIFCEWQLRWCLRTPKHPKQGFFTLIIYVCLNFSFKDVFLIFNNGFQNSIRPKYFFYRLSLLCLLMNNHSSQSSLFIGQIIFMNLFGVKFILFDIRKDIVCAWTLAYPTIQYISVVHKKIYVHTQPLLLWEILSLPFEKQKKLCKTL
jgi:hypothetical protein